MVNEIFLDVISCSTNLDLDLDKRLPLDVDELIGIDFTELSDSSSLHVVRLITSLFPLPFPLLPFELEPVARKRRMKKMMKMRNNSEAYDKARNVKRRIV